MRQSMSQTALPTPDVVMSVMDCWVGRHGLVGMRLDEEIDKFQMYLLSEEKFDKICGGNSLIIVKILAVIFFSLHSIIMPKSSKINYCSFHVFSGLALLFFCQYPEIQVIVRFPMFDLCPFQEHLSYKFQRQDSWRKGSWR